MPLLRLSGSGGYVIPYPECTGLYISVLPTFSLLDFQSLMAEAARCFFFVDFDSAFWFNPPTSYSGRLTSDENLSWNAAAPVVAPTAGPAVLWWTLSLYFVILVVLNFQLTTYRSQINRINRIPTV